MRRLFALALCLTQAMPIFADTEEAFQFYQEELQSITATRRVQPIQQSPVAVDVLTEEDIKASGVTNLWDLLRFRVGMDVYEDRSTLTGSRSVVSVRGFPSEFTHNILVMADGMSLYDPLNASTSWEQMPVQLQDVERIEIVRGSNAALYGSNAAQGVINIITKKPKDNTSFSALALAGNRGLQRDAAAFEQSGKAAGYRVSYTHQLQNNFDMTTKVEANDFLFSNKGNFRGYWNPSDKSTLELFTGGSWDTEGKGGASDGNFNFRQNFERLAWTQALRADSSLEVSAYRRDNIFITQSTSASIPGASTKGRSYEYFTEVLHRLGWWDGRMQSVYGTSVRYFGVTDADEFGVNGPYQRNAVLRGFVSNSLNITKQLTFTAAASGESSNTGGTQPAYQTALVAAPMEDHTFRASYSYSPDLPALGEKFVNFTQTSAPAGLLSQLNSPANNPFCAFNPLACYTSVNTTLNGNVDITTEKVGTTEIGYQGDYLSRKLRTEADLYYMQIRDEVVIIPSLPSGLPPAATLNENLFNSATAIARGAELALEYRFSPDRVAYTNYTYESVTDNAGLPGNLLSTPRHKWNLGGRFALGHGFTVSGNLGYKDAYTAVQTGAISNPDPSLSGHDTRVPAYWRLDAKLAYSPRKDVELFMAGQNLADSRHIESIDGENIPLTFEGGVTVKFGK